LLVGEEIIRDHIDVSRQKVIDCRRAATIRDLRHAEIPFEHHEFAQEVPGIALALVPVIQLAGISLCMRYESGHIVCWQPWSREHDQRIGREHTDRLHGACIECRLGKHEMGDAVGRLGGA
jgi:hypothetical protein